MERRFALAVFLYCAAIFLESSHAVPYDVDRLLPGIDKVVHAGMYGVLAGLVATGMRRSGRAYSSRVVFWVPVIFAATYGASDEFHQYFVPGRSCDILDEVSDFGGAIVVQYYLVIRRWKLSR